MHLNFYPSGGFDELKHKSRFIFYMLFVRNSFVRCSNYPVCVCKKFLTENGSRSVCNACACVTGASVGSATKLLSTRVMGFLINDSKWAVDGRKKKIYMKI
jgi:hypothetical protein